MIPNNDIRTTFATGLRDYTDVLVVRTNQTAPKPPYPHYAYTVTTLATANNGTWQKHSDGIDRKLVKQIWSLTALADNDEQSVELAMKARDWIENAGRLYLKDHGVTVQSVTQITNRDNVLSVGYEYKNGFDVIFYAYDAVETPDADNYIEVAEISRTY